MRLGICAAVESAADVRSAGADFLEENVQNLLQAQTPDSKWKGKQLAGNSALPVPAANCLLPGTLKIVGPSVDFAQVKSYTITVMRRAQTVGIKILVFGSAAARNLPEGFDRQLARKQILEFLAMAVPLAAEHSITLVAEPLSRDESNIIHTLSEAMSYVHEIGHPNFQCLLDTFHFWVNNDNLADLQGCAKQIRHVHVADRQGRVPPGESGKSDYRPVFRILKQAGYDGGISVESPGWINYTAAGPRVIAYLKRQWQES
ncbi:MAG: sugar phosphate isomerase/epimerase family protein [Tepidisphaeraceae bacterium]|jgi:sugar phosphate isomerase/epimerase